MTNPNALDDLVLRPLWRLVLLVDESQAQRRTLAVQLSRAGYDLSLIHI